MKMPEAEIASVSCALTVKEGPCQPHEVSSVITPFYR